MIRFPPSDWQPWSAEEFIVLLYSETHAGSFSSWMLECSFKLSLTTVFLSTLQEPCDSISILKTSHIYITTLSLDSSGSCSVCPSESEDRGEKNTTCGWKQLQVRDCDFHQIWRMVIFRAFVYFFSHYTVVKCGLSGRWKQSEEFHRIVWGGPPGDWRGAARRQQPRFSFPRPEKTEGLCQEKHWGVSKFTPGQMQRWDVYRMTWGRNSPLCVFPAGKIFVSSSGKAII